MGVDRKILGRYCFLCFEMDTGCLERAGRALHVFGTQREASLPLFLPKVGQRTGYESYMLCGQELFLARPTSVMSEDMTKELSVERAIEGRRTELDALASLMSGSEAKKSGC